jgi:hypothetical protein
MKQLLSIVIFAFVTSYCFPQSVIGDTSFVKISYDKSLAFYKTAIKGQEMYYNGSKYIEGRRSETHHPYFLYDELQKGSITFAGEYFDSVFIMYNASIDKVISESPNSTLIVLNPEKLQSFSINGHYFKRFETKTNNLPQTGFYEVIYSGKTEVIALRVKAFRERLDAGGSEIYYDVRNYYFVNHKRKFYPVRTKSSMLKVLSSQKSSLKSMIRKNKLRFSDNREAGLARIAELYDQLTAQ